MKTVSIEEALQALERGSTIYYEFGFLKRRATLTRRGDGTWAFRYPPDERLKFVTASARNTIISAMTHPRGNGDPCRILISAGEPYAEIAAEGKPDPPAGLVPLGPNRTRGGREVIVLKNDMQDGKSKTPVVAVMKSGSGTEILIRRRADGTSPSHKQGDLIGHLPPEPPKPREIWLSASGGYSFNTDGKPHCTDCKLFREVVEP